MHRIQAAYALNRHLEDQFHAHGISVELEWDFPALAKLRARLEMPELSPFFSPAHFDLIKENAFWLHGRDRNGETAFVVASRLDHLGDVPLADYWRVQWLRLFGGDSGAEGAGSDSMLWKISGRVVYQGELWVAKSKRGQGYAGLAVQMAMAWATLFWQPDWIVAVVKDRIARRGVNMREGYLNAAPMDEEWQWGPPYFGPNEWLLWMDRKSLVRMMQAEPRLDALRPKSHAPSRENQ